MNIEELKNDLQKTLRGEILDIQVKFKHKETSQVSFEIETANPISSHSLFPFCDGFTFMAIGEAKYYVSFITKILD